MDYHLQTTIPAGNAHRLSLPGDLEAAKAYALEHHQAPALMLFEGGGAEMFGGRLIALYTPESEWEDVIGDPLSWWRALSAETRAALAANPFDALSEAQMLELTEAGATVAAAYWVNADGEKVDDGFKMQFPDDVFVVVASRLGA